MSDAPRPEVPIITSVPDFPPAPTPTGPEYGAPDPTRVQRLALRAANVVMGGERGADDRTVFVDYATKVGGYTPTDEAAKKFGHTAGLEQGSRMVSTLPDETVRGQRFERKYKTGSDFDEDKGQMNLSGAVHRTAQGERRAEGKPKPVRHKLASKLIKFATKGSRYSGTMQ